MNNKTLTQILDEMLSDEIQAIPSEEEIKRKHNFTQSFLLSMDQLIQGQKKLERKYNYRYIYRTLKVAACAVCIIGAGTLLFTILPNGGFSTSKKDAAIENNTTEDTWDREDSVGLEESTEQRKEEGNISGDKENDMKIENDKIDNEEAFPEDVQLPDTDAWSLNSIDYNGSYQITVTIQNNTNAEMSFTPIYSWKYQIGEDAKAVNMDYNADTETKTLAPGETSVETYDLKDYELVDQAGGSLEITRDINGKESTLSFIIE